MEIENHYLVWLKFSKQLFIVSKIFRGFFKVAILTSTNGDIQKDALKVNLEKVTKSNDLRHQLAKEQLQVSTQMMLDKLGKINRYLY